MNRDISDYIVHGNSITLSSQLVSSNVLDSIDQVFSAEASASAFTPSSLSVRYVTQDQFYKIALSADSLSDDAQLSNVQIDDRDKTLYRFMPSRFSAYGKKIEDVGAPFISTDAANKWYVDDTVSTISTEITGKIDTINTNITDITADVKYLSGQVDATNATLRTVSSDYLKFADKNALSNLVNTTSAETLVSANAYTDTKFADLSNYYYAKNETSGSAEIASALTSIQASANSQFVHISGDTGIGTLTLSGDLVLSSGSEFQLIDSNYLQAAADQISNSYVVNLSQRNSFLQADCTSAYAKDYGPAVTGAKGWPVLSIYQSSKQIKLSGSYEILSALHEQTKQMTGYNAARFTLLTHSDSVSPFTIKSIVPNDTSSFYVYLDDPLKKMPGIDVSSETKAISNWINGEDNGFYCPRYPLSGWAIMPSMYSSHAEGLATKAIQRGTHAEGRGTVANTRYSHAEGSQTIAWAMYSHTEGLKTEAFGNASHAEGNQSEANGFGAHAEGGAILSGIVYKGGTASGAGSHAGGYETLAKGNWSYASGEQTSAIGRCTFAIGDRAQALSDDMFVWNGIRDSTYIPTNYNAVSGYFCINPKDGISGFYIGDNSMANLMLSANISTGDGVKTEVKTALNTALSSAFTDADGNPLNRESIDIGKLVDAISSLYVWSTGNNS